MEITFKHIKHIKHLSNRLSLLLAGILFFAFGAVSAQGPSPKKTEKKVNKYMQLAEEALAENNFPIAEANYRKAISLDTSNAVPSYNMGTLYYTKDKAAEAAERLLDAAKVSENETLKHRAFHNQGNAFMKQKNYKGAVEAYKNALRNDPTDDESRYNLALAKKLLEKEQQKKKNAPKDDKKKKEEKKGDEQKKEDQKGGGEQNKDKKKGDEKKSDKGDPKDKEQKDKNDQQKKEKPTQGKQQQQPSPGELSKQQIKNLLEAMKNQEQEVQEKINAQKAKGAKIKSEKDW